MNIVQKAAIDFILAIRQAGKRPNKNGVITVDPSKVKEDEMLAIRNYCGYDPAKNHGTQLDNAMRIAKARHLPHTTEHKRKLNSTIQGYVAGMPNNSKKALENLLGRQKLSLETLAGIENKIKQADEKDKVFLGKLAQVESNRLDQLTKQIRNTRE